MYITRWKRSLFCSAAVAAAAYARALTCSHSPLFDNRVPRAAAHSSVDWYNGELLPFGNVRIELDFCPCVNLNMMIFDAK